MLLCWGQQRCFAPPLSPEGESGSGERGLGLRPTEPQPPALTLLCCPWRGGGGRGGGERGGGGKAAESNKGEEGGGGMICRWRFSLPFNYALLSHQGWSHTPKPFFVHFSPPPDVGSVSS